MDEQLKSQLAESAGKLLQWAEATSKDADSLVREQAPLLAKEIVSLQLWTNAIAIIACLGVFFALYRAFKFCCAHLQDDLDSEIAFGGALVSIAVSVMVFLLALIPSVYSLCVAVFAPRVLVLQELQKLL